MALAREAREQRDLSRLNDEEYNRISQYGYERHTNLFLSDHDQYHWENSENDLQDFGRRDVNWLLANTPLSTTGKLSQIAMTQKWSGHGTSMIDLKIKIGQPSTTPCSIEKMNQLCDCPSNAAHDIGKGRGDPRNICIDTIVGE